jgi:ribosome-binding protein aMBF1 (putative translation factor)
MDHVRLRVAGGSFEYLSDAADWLTLPPQKGRRRIDKSQHTRTYRRLIDELRRAREKAGYTQEEVAEWPKTYASFVSKCESGERRIDVVALATFCRLYEVDLADFLRSIDLGS